MRLIGNPNYKTLRRGKGRDALVLGMHAAPSSGRLFVIYGGHRVPVDGFHHRFKTTGDELATAGVTAVVHASDPLGSSDDLRKVIRYALKHAKSLTGNDTPEIYLAGHSAGASAAAKVAEEFGVKRLLLVAPPKAYDLGAFTGELTSLIGSKDKDCLEPAQSMHKSAKAAKRRELVVVPGADHVFHTDETNTEYVNSFLAVGGAQPKPKQGRRVAHVALPSGLDMVVHPSQSNELLVIYGAKDTLIDGWKKRYYSVARKFARANEAAVIQIEHNATGEAGLLEALEYAQKHMQEITGGTKPTLTLMGHAGGANVAGRVAAHVGADRLLLIAPTGDINLDTYRGQVFTMAGDQDTTAVQHAALAFASASAAASRHQAVIPNADRKFHTADSNEAFLKSFRWALGLDKGFAPPPASQAPTFSGLGG